MYKDSLSQLAELNELRSQRNAIGKRVQNASSESEREEAISRAKRLKDRIHLLERTLSALETELHGLAYTFPNDTHPDVPRGSEIAVRLVSQHGPDPIAADPLRDHVRVATALEMLDMESGASVTGSSWYYLQKDGALLELALINYAISKAIRAGFTPITTPDVVKADIARRCGFHPRDGEASQTYHLQSAKDAAEPLVLAGTAELPLAGMFAGKVYDRRDLPILSVGLGRAFRAEAGARGVDTRGLYRVHQFTKVELFAVTAKEDSDAMLERLVALQMDIFDGLGLTYK
jgi:seryl-tRNA synthetase